ncbi:MAG: alpha amylase C-terminal domain-containing protein, partial [Bacteroidota bacterium]
ANSKRRDRHLDRLCPTMHLEIFNSDDSKYFGSSQLNQEIITTEDLEMHGRTQSIQVTIPPLGVSYIKHKN